eukprot:CAMPEP_0119331074 /NCGR_PEP_ID=MMETSP1333-20130426/79732_1 /TAXON_ID=418940 /ORGANISM="Scyphosphaera apsteinii, Strain RCC1455" /LENGTH=267 /DNA_ID=CAMNT_0007340595 /DNA_START=349 /DNA_END=1152 /DNA_ORIENTATION=-
MYEWQVKPYWPMREVRGPKLLKWTCPSCNVSDAEVLVNMSWDSVKASISGTGHNFCGLARDLWACDGNLYRQTLQHTVAYRSGMMSLPAGTFIYATGLSWFSQLLVNIICEEAIQVWKIALKEAQNDWLAAFGNGTYILHRGSSSWGLSMETALLKVFKPTLIVMGSHHDMSFGAVEAAVAASLDTWKLNVSGIVKAFGNPLSKGCRAEFSGCSEEDGHQCLPGPLARDSEQLLHLLRQCIDTPYPHYYTMGRMTACCGHQTACWSG